MLADLSALGASVPFGLSLAALAGERLRSGRRREALNRALHELRRPLQALSLAASGHPARAGASASALVTRQTVDAALSALADLDRAVNGVAPLPCPRPLMVADLIRPVAERWRARAEASGRSLRVTDDASSTIVIADRARVERAVENLVANALEHGRGAVRLGTAQGRGVVRIAVADDGPADQQPRRGRRGAVRGRDPRRGHGLRVVAEVAREHGGRFLLDRSRGRTEAVLELPLAGQHPGAPPLRAA